MSSIVQAASALRHVKQWVERELQVVEGALDQFGGHGQVFTQFAEIGELDERIHVIGVFVYYGDDVVGIEAFYCL